MGLAWATAWIPLGMMGSMRFAGELEPEWIAGPLYAAVICGAVFAAISGIASGRRRLDQLSVRTAAAWGAMSGLFMGAFPFVLGDNGGYENTWSIVIVVICTTAAGLAARAGWLGSLTISRAATIAATTSGLLAGPLQYALGPQRDAYPPWVYVVAIILTLTALGTVSAALSAPLSRLLKAATASPTS
jgi:hypothetical protein